LILHKYDIALKDTEAQPLGG